MGGGSWTSSTFTTYSTTRGRSVMSDGSLDASLSHQQIYVQKGIHESLNPHGVIRECRDTEEHPNTVPVILALDVTGSMGSGASAVAKKLNVIMTNLYKDVKDVEFMIMAIGDLAYDNAPIQVSQYESDIRIAEHLDKVYFEGCGGGNSYESYTAAWYIGLRHTNLDCWKRGRKGIIITMGDEPLNPYLPGKRLSDVTGDNLQGDVDTHSLYKDVLEKFDVYHLAINDDRTSYKTYSEMIDSSWGTLLGDHFKVSTLDSLADDICNIVRDHVQKEEESTSGIRW